MKKITFLTILVIATILNISAQSDTISPKQSPCFDSSGDFPSDFEGQKCWLLYALKEKIFVYGDKLLTDGINYMPIDITEEVVGDFLKYDKGANQYYLNKSYTAWGGNWYACRNGGIARRFNGDKKDYPLSEKLNWEAIKNMTKEELFKLSPAEKMDIYMNDSTFSITKFELKNRGPERPNNSDDGFCGFCNGARIAGAIMPEPEHEVTLWPAYGNNPLEITFSIGDIKALLSASYMHPAFTFSFGKPSEMPSENNPNPGIVDIMLRLYLAKYNVPFIVDGALGEEIFNETVLGYNREIGRKRTLTPTEKIKFKNAEEVVDIALTLYLLDEVGFEKSESPTIEVMSDSTKALNEYDPASVHGTWVYRNHFKYELYLDEGGGIVDGRWIGKPIDFVWAAHGDGNEDEHVKTNDTPGLPNTNRNKHLIWNQLSYILKKSIE